jgi:hypothetical protein
MIEFQLGCSVNIEIMIWNGYLLKLNLILIICEPLDLIWDIKWPSSIQFSLSMGNQNQCHYSMFEIGTPTLESTLD